MSIDYEELGTRMASDRTCVQCRGGFKPGRKWARFCSSKCRTEYHSTRLGVQGTVVGVTDSKTHALVMVHVDGTRRSQALNIKPGTPVKVLRS